jgi:Flp pilus assembly pilin Flp
MRYSQRKARSGQTTAEYAIIVALVAVASITVIVAFGDRIRDIFGVSADNLSGGTRTPAAPTDTSASEHKNLGNF